MTASASNILLKVMGYLELAAKVGEDIPVAHVAQISTLVDTLMTDLSPLVKVAAQNSNVPAPASDIPNPFAPAPGPPEPEPGTTGKTIAENLADGQALQDKLTKLSAAITADLNNQEIAVNSLQTLMNAEPSPQIQSAYAYSNEQILVDKKLLNEVSSVRNLLSNWLVNVNAGQPVGEGTTAGPVPTLTPDLQAKYNSLKS